MRAIRVHAFGKPDLLAYQDVPDLTPDPDQILVQVKAIGVNPVDTYIRSGLYPIKPSLPYTPGTDCAGEVKTVGSQVTDFVPGDRVYTSGSVTGTYAEFCLCTQDQVHRLPETISFEQGAGLGIPFATAYHALVHKAKVKPGQTILVHGASGGVGTAAVQLARSLNLTVLATAGTQSGMTLVSRLGAHHVLDHHRSNVAEQVMSLTQQRGVDVILEMLANENLAADLEMLATQGTVVVIGNRGTIEINPRFLMAKDASIQGMILMQASAEQKQAIFQGIEQGLCNGSLCPVIGTSLPLEQACQAHEQVIHASHQGKIVLIP